MLVMTRRAGEGLSIGDTIRVHVIAVSGGEVKIGIEAPRSVPILRDDAIETTPKQHKEGEQRDQLP